MTPNPTLNELERAYPHLLRPCSSLERKAIKKVAAFLGYQLCGEPGYNGGLRIYAAFTTDGDARTFDGDFIRDHMPEHA